MSDLLVFVQENLLMPLWETSYELVFSSLDLLMGGQLSRIDNGAWRPDRGGASKTASLALISVVSVVVLALSIRLYGLFNTLRR